MPIQEGGTFSPVDRIVSPGVFTRENDLSGIAQGVADIGGVIVAPFPKGPAFWPTLVRDLGTLQNKFGVADGTLYGPYTAAEYLSERGLVTICRVGGLSGYKQEYPFCIWAVSGSWNRSGSMGNLDETSSYIYPSGSVEVGFSQSFTFPTETSIKFNSASLAITFEEGAADLSQEDLGSGSIYLASNSGSILYYGQTISLGVTDLTSTNYFPGAATASVVSASIAAGTFSGSFTPGGVTLTMVGGNGKPFDVVTLYSASFATDLSTCGVPTIKLIGILSGSFGKYDGRFTAGTEPSFDECTNTWTVVAGTEYKLLAVLADTQYGGQSDLKAPGFSGSSMEITPSMTGATDVGTVFDLTLKNTDSTTAYGVYQFSTDASSTKYIKNVFGDDPAAGNPDEQVSGQKIEAAYLYKVFENALAEVVADKTKWYISGSALPNSAVLGEPLDFTDDYSRDLTNGDSEFSITNATTPWVLSQEIAPWQSGSAATRFRLFRVHTLADGTLTNTTYKIEISSVKLADTVAGSDWGSFTLTVRKYSDSDKKPVILEQYTNCNLDPDSSNYVARKVGDMYSYIDYKGKILEFGTYANNSKHIRIEMIDTALPVTAVPYGFEAFATPTNGSLGYWTPTMKYTKASIYGLNPGKYPSGVTFDDAPTGADTELAALYPTTSAGNGAADDNKQYMAPLPEFGAYTSVGHNVAFALDTDYQSYGVGTGSYLSDSNVVPAVYDAVNETTYVKMRKFVFGFQGGFDGQSPAIPLNLGGDIIPGNQQGMDCSTSTAAGSIAYQQAIVALGNADEFDINLIVVPGIVYQHHPYVCNLVVDMCEARGDCFFIMDLYADDGNPSGGQIDEVVAYAAQWDTNYACAYYPWVKILDINTNKIVTVPPSVVLPAVYAANDKTAAEWFAPAGLNRGGIPIATQVTDRTTHEERDTLYEGKVNPIAAFPGSGIVVWGQKTLQDASSALDRVNVRRLLINIKKFFASTSKYLVFEQNVASTRNKFLSIVNPYLESVQQRSGLYAFFVKMDEENNTPDIIDRNILYGQIYLKPTRTAEFIVLDFNILATGASFPNA